MPYVPKFVTFMLFMLFVSLRVSVAAADDEADAKDIYSKAVESYKTQNYDEALALFKEAYNLSEKPAILYNLAICHEKLGQTDHAIAFYELYLEEVPDASDAESVKKTVARLRNPDDAESPNEAPPTVQEQPSADPTPDNAKSTTPQINDNAVQGPLKVVTPPDPDAARNRIIQGLLIGTGSLVLGTGILTAIAATKKQLSYENVCAPNCSDEKVNKVKSLALAADIQMGIGIAAITVGVVWKILDKRKAAEQQVSQSGWQLVPELSTTTNGLTLTRRF